MKYVSIDVETTGMDPQKNQTLEIGMVVEDTSKKAPIDTMPVRRILVPHKEVQINTYCMNLHRELFATLDLVDWDILCMRGYYKHEPKCYFSTLDSVGALIGDWLIRHLGERKYVVAGKNFFGFDHNFLKHLLREDTKFHHRCLDPVIFYIQPDDEVPPDLAECCKRAGITIKGHHTAIGDAKTVIELIRRGCDK